jgi:MinD superfamily P-loop ATPase
VKPLTTTKGKSIPGVKNIIAVASGKGGVGKSLISSFIGSHEDIQATIYTNDKNGIYTTIFPLSYIYAKDINSVKIKEQHNYIFDLGGFSDNVIDLVKTSDVILVPTLSDLNSIKVCLDTIAEIHQINNNILVVESLYKNSSDLDEAISENFDIDIPLLKLRYSKIFDNALRKEQSIYNFVKGDKLKQITYKNVLQDIEDIVEVINILGENNEQ